MGQKELREVESRGRVSAKKKKLRKKESIANRLTADGETRGSGVDKLLDKARSFREGLGRQESERTGRRDVKTTRKAAQ